jgi:sortase (surface protein transpeptidase)
MRVGDVPERQRLSTRTACSYLLALLMLGGCATAGASDMSPPAATASATPSLTPHSNLSTYRSTRTHSEIALPVRLRIPAIEVDTRLVQLGLERNKSIEVPDELGVAGWWEGGPRPGQVGPAVILGHVSWKAPAVFSRLHTLQRGDEILVDRADGTTARFVVTGQGTYQKVAFPSDLVYYPTLEPELRLVTCGGPIDRATGHYRENVVVFAAQAP